MTEDRQPEAELVNDNVPARPGEVMPGIIHLLPVAARPFFPGQVVPLLMDEAHWASTMQAVSETPHKLIGIVLTRSETAEEAGPRDFHRVGTVGRIHRAHAVEGQLQVLVECLQRLAALEAGQVDPVQFLEWQERQREREEQVLGTQFFFFPVRHSEHTHPLSPFLPGRSASRKSSGGAWQGSSHGKTPFSHGMRLRASARRRRKTSRRRPSA